MKAEQQFSDTSDLWLGVSQEAWRRYDNHYADRSKPSSQWLVQPPAAIANAATSVNSFFGQSLLRKWQQLMHQFGMNAKCLSLCLDRSRPWAGDRDYEIRACTRDQRAQLKHIRECEASARAKEEGVLSTESESAAESAAAASIDAAIADLMRCDAAAAPPPPLPPRHTRRLAGLDISTEVQRPTRLYASAVVQLKIYGKGDAAGWRRSAAFPDCEFHSEHKISEEAHGLVYFVAVRSCAPGGALAGSSGATTARGRKRTRAP
jgi:hypothetical protein